jgi:hypothetical protein
MTNLLHRIRVFVASPGDVGDLRDDVSDVAAALNMSIAPANGLVLECVRWETHSVPTMGRPQQAINDQTQPYDIFIGIMWKRFGTPTGQASGGTEEEFDAAFRSWKMIGVPRIMFYFCTEPFFIRSSDELAQFARVTKFRERLQGLALVSEFSERRHFREIVRRHLERVVVNAAEEADDVRLGSSAIHAGGPILLSYAPTVEYEARAAANALKNAGLSVVARPLTSDVLAEEYIDEIAEVGGRISVAVFIVPKVDLSSRDDQLQAGMILQIGYFVGRLGAQSVILLLNGGVLPNLGSSKLARVGLGEFYSERDLETALAELVHWVATAAKRGPSRAS